MSKEYRDAMDKIVLSDEMKEKILKKAAEKEQSALPSSVHTPGKRTRCFYLRYGMSYAACIVLCAATVFVGRGYLKNNEVKPADEKPPVIQSDTVEVKKPQSEVKNADTGAAEDENTVLPQGDVQPDKGSVKPSEVFRNSDETREPSDGNRVSRGEGGTGNGETARPGKTNAAEAAQPGSSGTDRGNHVQPDSANPEGGDFVQSGNPDPGSDDFEQSGNNNPVDSDLVQSGNPFAEIDDLKTAQSEVGYVFGVPGYMPDGYEIKGVALLFGTLVQLLYENGNDDRITYRTEKTNDDISGDYSVYEKTEITDGGITIKGNDGLYCTAVWNDGENAYSVYSEDGLTRNEILKIVSSVCLPDTVEKQ